MKRLSALILVGIILINLNGQIRADNRETAVTSKRVSAELAEAVYAANEDDEIPTYVILQDIDTEAILERFVEFAKRGDSAE